MLDPDEMAEYEAWKQRKLTSHPDLTVNAFNTEMEAQAIAWDEGYKTASNTATSARSNPYRQPGMRGHNRRDAPQLPATAGQSERVEFIPASFDHEQSVTFPATYDPTHP